MALGSDAAGDIMYYNGTTTLDVNEAAMVKS